MVEVTLGAGENFSCCGLLDYWMLLPLRIFTRSPCRLYTGIDDHACAIWLQITDQPERTLPFPDNVTWAETSYSDSLFSSLSGADAPAVTTFHPRRFWQNRSAACCKAQRPTV